MPALIALWIIVTAIVVAVAVWLDEREAERERAKQRRLREATWCAEQRIQQLTADALHRMLDESRGSGAPQIER